MVVVQNQAERVVNALLEIGRIGPYHPRSIDKDTGAVTIDDDVHVPPKTVYADEVEQSYGPAMNTQHFCLDVTEWLFDLKLAFNRGVSLETLIQNLLDQPPIIPWDDDRELSQVTLLLKGSTIKHPPQQQPQIGTRATLRVQAAVVPR